MKWVNINRGSLVDGTLWLGEPYADNGLHLHIEVSRNHITPALEFQFGGETNDFGLHVAIPWVAGVFLQLGGVFPWAFRRKSYARSEARVAKIPGTYAHEIDPFEGRTTGVRWFHGTLWVDFWKSDAGWRNVDTPGIQRGKWQWGILPWNGLGWSWSFPVVDYVLGSTKHEQVQVESKQGFIKMPEGLYPAVGSLYRVRWLRKGLLGRLLGLGRKWSWRVGVEVLDADGGSACVPVPGKGTTSYNCGDDGTYSTTFAAVEERPNLEDYFERFANDAMKRREKYASLTWVPSKGWPLYMVPHPDEGEG